MKQVLILTLTVASLFSPYYNVLIKDSVKRTNSGLINTSIKIQNTDLLHYDFAYLIGTKIYVYNDSTKTSSFVINGTDPAISPDGKQLAFTEQTEKLNKYGRRINQICIVDLMTKNKRILEIDNINIYGPAWSPDGKYILFNLFNGKSWTTGLIDQNNNFKVLTKTLSNVHQAYSPTWNFDSKIILVHDIDTVYFFNLNGLITKKIPTKSLINMFSLSSATRFFLTSTEDQLIFNAEARGQGYDTGPEAIFSYDLKTNKLKKVTPEGIYCRKILSVTPNNIFFSLVDEKFNIKGIYKIKLNGENLELFLDNASEISLTQKFYNGL
jgi:TolB protein